MEKSQLNELLYQALETEKGGMAVYKTAIQCAVNEDLKEEWEEYLEQTANHERILLEVFEKLDLDPETDSGRRVVRTIGKTLVGHADCQGNGRRGRGPVSGSRMRS